MSRETRIGIIEALTCFVLIALMVIGFWAVMLGFWLFVLFGMPKIMYAVSMGYITSYEVFFYGSLIVLIPVMLIQIRDMLARERNRRKEKWLM